MKLNIKIFLMILVLTLVAVGCSDNDTSEESKEGNDENSEEELIPMRIGSQPSLQAREYVARSEDLFLEAGLDVEFIKFNTGLAMFPAFTKDEVDVAYFGWTGTIVGPSQGIDIKTFAVEVEIGGNEGLVAKKDSEINELKDIKGKKIGTTNGTSAHFALLTALESENLTPEDVDIVNIDPPQMIPAFEKEEVDAIWAWDPWMRKLMAADGELITVNSEVGLIGHGDWVVSGKYMENNEEGIQRFLEVMDKASEILEENPEIAASSMSEALAITPEQALDIIKDGDFPKAERQLDETFSISMNKKSIENEEGIAKSWLETSDFLLEQDLITNVPDYEDSIITDPLEKYVEEK